MLDIALTLKTDINMSLHELDYVGEHNIYSVSAQQQQQ